jgi:drug/metabolite transporter (DMT)-like permease
VEAAEQPGRFRRVAPTGAALNWAILLVLVIVWGSTFAGIRMAVETIHPLWTVAGRMVSATIFLAFFLLISKTMSGKPRGDVQGEITPRAIFAYSFIGILFTATPFVLYSIAAQTTGSAVMAICNGGTPFVTTLAAHFLVKDRLTARRIAGVLMGFLGLAVLVWPEAQKGFGNSSLFGIILAIVGAALYAGGNVGTRMSPKLSPLMSSLILVGAGAAAATLAALFLAPWPQEASVKSIIAVLMIGLFPTAIAMILYVWLIQRTGAVFVSFTTYLSPLWATGLGVIFLNEPLHWSMIGALALILAGVAVANARLRLSSAS